MGSWKFDELNRREFIKKTALTGAAAYLGIGNDYGIAAVEPPPETTTLRLLKWRTACWAPQYVAEPLLHEEGFTDIQYVEGSFVKSVKEKQIDMNMTFSAIEIVLLDKYNHGNKIISGLHPGCYVLLGNKNISSVRELKGKTVWAGVNKGGGPHIFLSAIVSYVGLDPRKDINIVWIPKEEALEQFKKGEIAAFISFPPEPQALLAQDIGHRLIDTNVDKPWSQYFCCMICGREDFIKDNPVATKRALRAILRANDIVARDPELATRHILEHKVRKESEKEHIIQAFKETPYETWREFNPEETIRFFSLRLHDVGMIKTPPKEIIARHTNWSFIKGLKKELALQW